MQKSCKNCLSKCGPQPEQIYNSKAKQGAVSFAQGKYDVLLFAEHRLNHSKMKQSQKWNNRMNYYSKGSYLIVSFNKTGNCEDWKQPNGTGITITMQEKIKKEVALIQSDWTGQLG